VEKVLGGHGFAAANFEVHRLQSVMRFLRCARFLRNICRHFVDDISRVGAPADVCAAFFRFVPVCDLAGSGALLD